MVPQERHVSLSQACYYAKLARNLVAPPRLDAQPSSLPKEDKDLMTAFLETSWENRFLSELLFSNGPRPSLRTQAGVVFFMGYVNSIDDAIDEEGATQRAKATLTEMAAEKPLKVNPSITMDMLKEKMLACFEPDKQEVILDFLRNTVNSYHVLHSVPSGDQYGYDQAYQYHTDTNNRYLSVIATLIGTVVTPRQYVNFMQTGIAGKIIDDLLDCLDDTGTNMLLGLARDNGELQYFEEVRRKKAGQKLSKLHTLLLIKQTLIKAKRTRMEYFAKYRETIRPFTGIPHKFFANAAGIMIF